MAAFDSSRVQHASAGVLGQFFASLFAGVIGWYDARKTRLALAKLTDRELEDIGLLRRDIHTIV